MRISNTMPSETLIADIAPIATVLRLLDCSLQLCNFPGAKSGEYGVDSADYKNNWEMSTQVCRYTRIYASFWQDYLRT
jgi:hypothetical protein